MITGQRNDRRPRICALCPFPTFIKYGKQIGYRKYPGGRYSKVPETGFYDLCEKCFNEIMEKLTRNLKLQEGLPQEKPIKRNFNSYKYAPK